MGEKGEAYTPPLAGGVKEKRRGHRPPNLNSQRDKDELLKFRSSSLSTHHKRRVPRGYEFFMIFSKDFGSKLLLSYPSLTHK